MKRLKFAAAGVLILLTTSRPGGLAAQNDAATKNYQVVLEDIEYQKVHKNWLRVPTAVDLRLSWTITVQDVSNDQKRELIKDPKNLPFTYQVSVYDGDSKTATQVRKIEQDNHADFLNMKVGQHLSFRVRAYGANSELVAESAMASIVIGKGQDPKDAALAEKSLFYYFHPGRWQLATIGKANIYDQSTALGKLAFMFLSITAVLSCVILLFYSSRTLYLGNIFPYRRSAKNVFWSLSLSCDSSYENRLTNKFKFVLKAWEMIAAKSKLVADQAVKSIPSALSSTEKMASVDVACMEYWTHDGDRAIATIEDIISYPEDNFINGKHKSPDDLLTELVIKIEDNFHELLLEESANGSNGGYGPKYDFQPKEDMKRLIEEIYEPVITDEKAISRFRKWILRKGVLDLKKGLRPFPTSRIIHAGLKIHRMNGYRWSKPTEEVKRAFEDRASNEIETLKRKSRIEWFWNYGALAPLVGLFGTVTGITFAFQQLSKTSAVPDFGSTIQLLSNGIFEALWTTIFGLANGIFFIMVHYYYKHKLDWIYSKWEEIYVTITEKL
ncbi:MAG: MotA/TolQ/ExbB proton channel family protein [bacterium]